MEAIEKIDDTNIEYNEKNIFQNSFFIQVSYYGISYALS